MHLLKNFVLIVLSLLTSQFVMYYFIDELIVVFAASPVPYIIGRFFLAFVIFGCFKFLMKEFEIESIYINLAMILYLIFLFSITLFRGNSKSTDSNFMPFNFLTYASEANLSTFTAAVLINMLILAPLGVYLRIKNIKFTFSWQVILYGSLLIEGLQFFTRRGSFDVEDLMLNTIGGGLAYLVVSLIHNQFPKAKLSNSFRKSS